VSPVLGKLDEKRLRSHEAQTTLCVLLLCGLFPAKASADNRFIVRTTLDLQGLQTVCNPLLLTPICTVIGSGLGDPQGQLFTITTPLALNDLLALPGNLLGIVDAEVDQLVSLFPIGSLNVLPSASAGYLTPLMSDRTLVPYPASSGRTSECNGLSPCVWDAYANQPRRELSVSRMRKASLASPVPELSRTLTRGWILLIPRYRVSYCQGTTLRAISRVVRN